MRDLDVGAGSGAGVAIASCGDSVLELGGSHFPGLRMRFSANAEVFGEGEPADYVYRVLSGAVRTIRFTADGRRQIVAFHLPGDVFGFDLAPTHNFTAEAVADAELLLTRRASVQNAAAQNLDAAQALLQLSSSLLREAHEHALVLGRKGASERVAAFLLSLFKRLAPRREIDLPMSRADIADYLALTVETVSRTFTQLERECAIALPSSRHVVVQNGALLRGFCTA